MKLTATDLLTTCGKHEERLAWVSPAVEAHAHVFVEKLNAFLMMYGHPVTLSSGFRDILSNKAAGGGSMSWHMFGLAADVQDRDGKLGEFVLANTQALIVCGLYAEHPTKTVGWVHLQSEPPPSGKRIFYP